MTDADDIQTNSQNPQEAAAGGVSAKQVPIPDQIEADRYARSNAAAANRSFPIRTLKIYNGGAVGS